MSITAGDFINQLAINSGIASDDANLKKLLSSVTFASQEIPSELAEKIQSNHLTVEAAKANPAIISHFREANFSAVDRELMDALKEIGLDEEINKVLTPKNTIKNIKPALKKLAELKEKQATAATDGLTGKAAEYQKQIEALTRQIGETNANAAAEKQTLLKQFEGERKEWVINQMLSNYEYAGEQRKEVQTKLAKILLDDHLKEKGYQTKYENGNLELVTSEGTPVFDNNTKITLKAFTDKLVADNKLIKVSGATPPANNGANGNPQQPFIKPNTNGTPTVFDKHLSDQLANAGITLP